MKNYNHSKLTIFDKETLELLHKNAEAARIRENKRIAAAKSKKAKEDEIIFFILLGLIALVFGCIGGLLTI